MVIIKQVRYDDSTAARLVEFPFWSTGKTLGDVYSHYDVDPDDFHDALKGTFQTIAGETPRDER